MRDREHLLPIILLVLTPSSQFDSAKWNSQTFLMMRFNIIFGILNVAFDTPFCLFSCASFLFGVSITPQPMTGSWSPGKCSQKEDPRQGMNFSPNAHLWHRQCQPLCGEEKKKKTGTELCMGMEMTICPKIHFLINAGFVLRHHERQLCVYWKQGPSHCVVPWKNTRSF